MALVAGIFSICALLCYMICYTLTTERIKLEPTQKEENVSLAETFKTIISNRALLAIIGAAIVLLLSQFMGQTMNQYLFASYFKNINALSSLSMVGLPLSLGLATVSGVIASKFGKKEFSAFGMFLAATQVLDGIYALATLFPAVCYGIVALIMLLGYPLSKKVIAENGRILAEKRANQ